MAKQQRFSALDRIKRRWEPTLEELGPGKTSGSLPDAVVLRDLVHLPHSNQRLASLPTCTADSDGASAGAVAAAVAAVAPYELPAPASGRASRGAGGLILMPGPLAGGNLGLAIHNLEVTGITDPAAYSFGWSVGDQILALNGAPVASQEQLRVAVDNALQNYAAYGKPLVFEVSRGGRGGGNSGNHGGASSGSTGRRQRDDDCCCWCWPFAAASPEPRVDAGMAALAAHRQETYPMQDVADLATTGRQDYDPYAYSYTDARNSYHHSKPAFSQYGELHPYFPGIPAEWDFEESRRRRDTLCV